MRRNRTGSAYITAVIISLTAALLVATVLSVTRYERIVTDNYNKYSGSYSLAVSAAEHGIGVIDRLVTAEWDAIYDEAMDGLRSLPLESSAVYVSEGGERYNGSFHLAESGERDALFGRLAVEAARRRVNTALGIAEEWDTYEYSFSIASDGGRHDVRIGIGMDRISAEVVKTPGNIRDKASAELSFIPPPHGELLLPAFAWRSPPGANEPFGCDVYATGSIVGEVEGAVSGAPGFSFDEGILRGYIHQKLTELQIAGMTGENYWSPDNPVSVNFEGTFDTLDAESFRFNGEPVCTLIINTGGTLSISAETGGELKGVIISQGDVVLNNVNFTGCIAASGDVTLNGGRVTYDADAVFKFRTADAALGRMLLDYLGITAFKNAELSVHGDMSSLLGRATMTDGWELNLVNFDAVRARMVKLAENENEY